MYKTGVELLAVSDPDQVDKLAQRAYYLRVKFHQMSLRAQEMKEFAGVEQCGRGKLMAQVLLEAADALKNYDFLREEEKADPAAAAARDPNPLAIEDARMVLPELELQFRSLRRYLPVEAQWRRATGQRGSQCSVWAEALRVETRPRTAGGWTRRQACFFVFNRSIHTYSIYTRRLTTARFCIDYPAFFGSDRSAN